MAVVGGCFGLHRFYLHGPKDLMGWLVVLPTLLGLHGVQRMRHIGVDDHLAWALIPLLGVTLSIAMVSALVLGLTPDEKWQARFNPNDPVQPTGWIVIIGVITAMSLGTGVLMATIAFSAQRYFEYQSAPPPQ
jgi:hypothetical protein